MFFPGEHDTQSCSFHSGSTNSLGGRSHFCFSYGPHHFEVSPITGESVPPRGKASPRTLPGHTCAVGGACLPGPAMDSPSRAVFWRWPLHAHVVKNQPATTEVMVLFLSGLASLGPVVLTSWGPPTPTYTESSKQPGLADSVCRTVSLSAPLTVCPAPL